VQITEDRKHILGNMVTGGPLAFPSIGNGTSVRSATKSSRTYRRREKHFTQSYYPSDDFDIRPPVVMSHSWRNDHQIVRVHDRALPLSILLL
jgi:hypothetical protein